MLATVDRDRTAFAGHAPGRTRRVTTFAALITALHESSAPGEDDLTFPRNKNATLPAMAHKSPLTISGLKH